MLVLLGNGLAPTLRDAFKRRVENSPGVHILPASLGKFESSEAFSEIKTKPGDSLAIVQSLAAVDTHTANDFATELLFAVRTAKRHGAGPIWIVEPYAGYSREDRAVDGRMVSVGLDDYAFFLKQAGAVGFSTIELHSKAGVKILQDQFGDDRVYNLDPTDLFVEDIASHYGSDNLGVGGPDAGANERADAVARRLNAAKFAFTKTHVGVNETKTTGFTGDVRGRRTVTIDDMIDTGGTIINSQIGLETEGATERIVEASHALLSDGALQKLFTAKTRDGKHPAITQLVVTDTVDIGLKLAALKSQYGDQDVDARVRQLSTGNLLYAHLERDILRHPTMKMRPG